MFTFEVQLLHQKRDVTLTSKLDGWMEGWIVVCVCVCVCVVVRARLFGHKCANHRKTSRKSARVCALSHSQSFHTVSWTWPSWRQHIWVQVDGRSLCNAIRALLQGRSRALSRYLSRGNNSTPFKRTLEVLKPPTVDVIHLSFPIRNGDLLR